MYPALALLLSLLIPRVALAAPLNFEHAVATGPMSAMGVAFLGGLLVSLTPCVYPMIAITVSVFGARSSQGRFQGLGLSASFVLGICSMFTPLGLAAGLSGGLFGSILQNPWVLSFVAVVFLLMAASMFGAFELALPGGLNNRLAQVGGLGYRGAFGLGLVCGLIAAPCTGPVLTGILAFITQTRDPVLGSLAMLAFSLGLGLPFFLVGAFAIKLPKSGSWMMAVKSVLGSVLVVVALYYLNTAFPSLSAGLKKSVILQSSAAAAVVLGVALGAVHLDFKYSPASEKLRKALGLLLVCSGAFLLVLTSTMADRKLAFRPGAEFEAAVAQAKTQGQPVLIDFTAKWCGACKELEKLTFADPEVNQEAGRFVAIQVDATSDEDPKVQALMSQLHVVGLPTLILLGADGAEVRRFTDFVPKDEFLKALQAVH